jgi:DNA polymerase III, alpha subunit
VLNPHSDNASILNDRILWFDGDSSFEPDAIADMVLNGLKISKNVHVHDINSDVEEYNKIAAVPLGIKRGLKQFDPSWKLPKEFLEMDIEKYLFDRLDHVCRNVDVDLTEAEIYERFRRIAAELAQFEELNLIMLLRTCIYIVDTFRKGSVVWGVGRGSSCASYILYLVGTHDIDSVKYELDYTEFLRIG